MNEYVLVCVQFGCGHRIHHKRRFEDHCNVGQEWWCEQCARSYYITAIDPLNVPVQLTIFDRQCPPLRVFDIICQ